MYFSHIFCCHYNKDKVTISPKLAYFLVCFFFKALLNITDQQIYCDLVAGEEDNTFLKE